jgi:hypothetical protein
MDAKEKSLRRKVRRLLDDLAPDQLDIAISEILEDPVPMAALFEPVICRIPHDDCDGDMTQELVLSMDVQGDMWIGTACGRMLRFRTIGGGTRYPYVHNALRILILAMKIDRK